MLTIGIMVKRTDGRMNVSVLMRENLNGTFTSSAIIHHLSSHAEHLQMQMDKQLWIKSNSSIHHTNLTLAHRFTKFVMYINVLLEDDSIFISISEIYSINLTQTAKPGTPILQHFTILRIGNSYPNIPISSSLVSVIYASFSFFLTIRNLISRISLRCNWLLNLLSFQT